MCTDFSDLNLITTNDLCPTLRADDCLDHLKNTNMYTGLDLISEYPQIECDARSQSRTAFISPEGHFYFKIMPFDLCNAPATFGRMIDKVLLTNAFDGHLERLAQVFTAQRSQFANQAQQMLLLPGPPLFLGHIVSARGLEQDPEKVLAITNIPAPENLTQVRSFLRACTQFGRLISNYS